MPNPTITTIRPKVAVLEIQFCAWVAQAVPVDRLEYHRGHLAVDADKVTSHLDLNVRADLALVRDRAFWAAEQGLVHLVQERVVPDQFAYIAVARPKPKAAAVSLSELLLTEPEAA